MKRKIPWILVGILVLFSAFASVKWAVFQYASQPKEGVYGSYSTVNVVDGDTTECIYYTTNEDFEQEIWDILLENQNSSYDHVYLFVYTNKLEIILDVKEGEIYGTKEGWLLSGLS